MCLTEAGLLGLSKATPKPKLKLFVYLKIYTTEQIKKHQGILEACALSNRSQNIHALL